jgi:hypothetical protein
VHFAADITAPGETQSWIVGRGRHIAPLGKLIPVSTKIDESVAFATERVHRVQLLDF